MSAKIPHFETMEEPELNYIKVWLPLHNEVEALYVVTDDIYR